MDHIIKLYNIQSLYPKTVQEQIKVESYYYYYIIQASLQVVRDYTHCRP